MHLKEFSQNILSEIIAINHTKNNTDIFVLLEERFALNKLYLLLEKHSNCDEEISIQNLKPFCDYLSQRWLEIKFSDAAYPHNPHSKITQACLIVAQHLAKMTGEGVYTFLMPSVAALMSRTSRGALENFTLYDFILGDDGSPIEIEKCFLNAMQNKTNVLCRTDHLDQPLSFAEHERIVHHSIETEYFFNALNCLVKANVEDELENAKEKLHQALLNNDYQVKASYGIKGREKLIAQVLKNIHNSTEFINLMTLQLDPSQWKEFLQNINFEFLSKLLLSGKDWKAVIQDKNMYSPAVLYNNALLFCVIELLIKNFTDDRFLVSRNWIAYHSKKFFGPAVKIAAFNKQQKQDLANILQQFLTKNYAFSELSNYLSDKKYVKYQEVLSQWNNDLFLICAQIHNLSITQETKSRSLV